MKGRGTPLEMIEGWTRLADQKTGLHFVIVKSDTNRHDCEALRDHLQNLEVNALILTESVLKEIRHLDKWDLKGLKASVDEALEEINAFEPAGPPGDATKATGPMTPERVVNALQRRPKLLRGVYELLRDGVGDLSMGDDG